MFQFCLSKHLWSIISERTSRQTPHLSRNNQQWRLILPLDHFLISNSTPANILDSFAPFKIEQAECKSAGRLTKKRKIVKLQISHAMLQNFLTQFQRTVKPAWLKYSSELIPSNCHRPKVVFITINAIIKTTCIIIPHPSTETCEIFLKFFLDKIVDFRRQISPSSNIHLDPPLALAVFTQFKPVSLSFVQEVVRHQKLTNSSDHIPHSY